MIELPPLHEWETFYVILGSSAAALTGIMFVVITLTAEAKTPDRAQSLRAFGTPTVMHFAAVLLVSAFATTPGHTVTSLRFCVLATGVAGLGYATFVTGQAKRQAGYSPVAEDWIWHSVFPFLAYVGLVVSAFLVGTRPAAALDVVAGSALLLLFVGIHNAWDAAVWMTSKRGESKENEP